MIYKTCPKCGAANDAGPPDQCTACGVFYAKWLKASLAAAKPTTGAKRRTLREDPTVGDRRLRWLHVAEVVNPYEFWARCAVLACMLVWGVLLIQTDFRVTTGLFPEISFYEPIIGSVTLIFHEAGHVLFSLFGRFLAVLGGSLFQLLVPAGLTLGFVYYYRNPFAGAVTLWWLGFSCMDLATYVYDARDMQLMLLGGGRGGETGGHDWNNLLTWTNAMDHHESLASLADFCGELATVASVAWGAWLLRLQFVRLDRR